MFMEPIRSAFNLYYSNASDIDNSQKMHLIKNSLNKATLWNFGNYYYIMLMPLLSSIPFASAYLEDKKTGFINNLSGYKNLKLLSDINKTISEDEIRKYMNFFGLDPYDKKKVKNYSLGMKQKLGLIQALMEDPKILILDEPMNALEEETVIKVRELLKKIKKEKIILLSSHNKEDIDLLCDRIYHVKDRHIYG
ncbi:hypothetical protein DP145_13145 [Clostridium tetani]|nr:hypothetical protein DP126_12510 [Clostridium tetani]RXM59603.1 hypothetical protein DP138_12785 [Clostridium tetani]RXM63747.1 hypothetical protein DP145_13145 [Clostridium tetani]RXM73629.1 hypothetical protein DP143_04285 [Clostridium tetani]